MQMLDSLAGLASAMMPPAEGRSLMRPHRADMSGNSSPNAVTEQRNGRQDMPEDLGTWVDRKALVDLVFSVVRAGDADPLGGFNGSEARRDAPCERMLMLLTYSYATGRYRSQQIVENLFTEDFWRPFFQDDPPKWHDLRLFRRGHRPLLKRCLENVFNSICPRPWGATHAESALTETMPTRPERAEQEADRRLSWAAQLDSMDLDD